MVDGAATTPPTNERNSGMSEQRHINLLPWVLVSAYDHARVISIEQEQRVIMWFVSKEPEVAESELHVEIQVIM